MKKGWILLLMLLISSFSVLGVQELWNKTFDGGESALPYGAAVYSNDLYVVGYGVFTGGQSDWWLKKFDSDGVEDTANWNLSFDYAGNNDFAEAIAIDDSGEIYVVGSGNSALGDDNWWIKKFNSSGYEYTSAEGWDINLSEFPFSDIARSVAVDNTGENIYVVGSVELNAGGTKGWFLQKYNSTGSALENITYLNASAYDVAIDFNGDVYVVGTYEGGTDVDWHIKKYNGSNGQEFTAAQGWNKTIDGAHGKDIAQAVAVDDFGNIYVAGVANNLTGSGTDDWWVKKFSSNGTEDASWNKSIDGGGDDAAYDVMIDFDSNIFVVGAGEDLVGSTGPDWWVKKFSADGTEDTTWNVTFDAANSSDIPYAVVDGSVYVVGRVRNINNDWHIKKLDDDTTGAVPEWSDYALILILVTTVGGFFYIRRKDD